MSRITQIIALFMVLVASSCATNTGSSPSVSCERPSDCASGSTCLAGRCVIECRDARDCIASGRGNLCDVAFGVCREASPDASAALPDSMVAVIDAPVSAPDTALDTAPAPASAEGPTLDSASRGGSVTDEGAGAGVCPSSAGPGPAMPWISQKLSRFSSWTTPHAMCCGPTVATYVGAVVRGASTLSESDLIATIDWMGTNLPGWSSNGYACSGTSSDQLVRVLNEHFGVEARAALVDWCTLIGFLDPEHVVIFEGDTQGSNDSQTFRAGASHWLALREVTTDGFSVVHDPGRTSASQGANRRYLTSSVRARFEARGRLAVIVTLRRSCPAGSPCTPGQTRSCTGPCGSGMQLCTPGCTWSDCSAPTTGECTTGAVGTCTASNGRAGTRSCGALCRWNVCVATPCAAPTTDCGGVCIDLTSTVSQCGACGRPCAPPTGGSVTCVGGVCRGVCSASRSLCGTFCIDTTSDAANCGACAIRCASGSTCVGGRCTPTCRAGQTACPAGCVDTSTNASNCGGCDRRCGVDATCVSGQCVTPTCNGYLRITSPAAGASVRAGSSFALSFVAPGCPSSQTFEARIRSCCVSRDCVTGYSGGADPDAACPGVGSSPFTGTRTDISLAAGYTPGWYRLSVRPVGMDRWAAPFVALRVVP